MGTPGICKGSVAPISVNHQTWTIEAGCVESEPVTGGQTILPTGSQHDRLQQSAGAGQLPASADSCSAPFLLNDLSGPPFLRFCKTGRDLLPLESWMVDAMRAAEYTENIGSSSFNELI